MQKKRSTSTHPRTTMQRSALTLSAVVLFLVLQGTSLGQPAPQPLKRVGVGVIDIYTSPGSYPILIDGKPAGRTVSPTPNKPMGRFTLPLGTHTIEIRFPNNHRWKKPISFDKEHMGCLGLTYTARDPQAGNAQPIPALPTEGPVPFTEFFDMTFSDGARVTASRRCLLGAPVPNVPLNSRKPKRKSTRKN